MCLRDGQKRRRVCGSPELQGIGKGACVFEKSHRKRVKDSIGFVVLFAQNQSRSEEEVERHLTVSTAKKRRGRVEGSGNHKKGSVTCECNIKR